MKRYIVLPAIVGILLGIFLSRPASAISENQANSIVQNCASIKQSLRALQRADARARSYLGSSYENILTNYITPLNLRLVSTNQPNTNLTTLHSEIIDTRKNFVSGYTAYAQSLEDLIASDCFGQPEEFYNKLYNVREKRNAVSTTTTNFRNLLAEYLTAVRKLKNTIGAKDDAE